MMQENKTAWTPGPWVVFDADQSIGTVEDANGRSVAQAQMRGTLLAPALDERRANARLIAAAPELYEALEDLVGQVSQDGKLWVEIESLLKRARFPVAPLKASVTKARAVLAKAANSPNPHTEDQP